jgi:hypothetical protein
MKLIEREPASHWYLRDGRPYYEVAKNDFVSAIHARAKCMRKIGRFRQDAALLGFFELWREWFDANAEEVSALEQICVNLEHGYSGGVDLVAKVKGVAIRLVLGLRRISRRIRLWF